MPVSNFFYNRSKNALKGSFAGATARMPCFPPLTLDPRRWTIAGEYGHLRTEGVSRIFWALFPLDPLDPLPPSLCPISETRPRWQ